MKLKGQTTLNGKPFKITKSWDEMTFAQFLRILKLKDDNIELISILTGLEYAYLKKAEIKGFDKLLYLAQFINKPTKFPENPTHIGKYKLPLNSKGVFDVQFESLAQFEDMRNTFNSLQEGIHAHTEAYATYCAIYAQKLRDGVYDGDKAMAMIPEIILMPAKDVVPAGSFFFLKLKISSLGINPSSPSTSQNRGKKGGKSIRKRSESRPRLTKSRGR